MDPSSHASDSPILASSPPILDLAARTSICSPANSAKIARISERPAALKTEWNNTAPVNSLPNELFVEIFLLAEPCYIGNGERTRLPNTRAWAPLMLVCRHWRDVILSTPRLWRVMYTGRDLAWMRLAVSRSQNATLDISFGCNSPVLASHSILLPVAQRIAALEFSSMDEGRLGAALALVDRARSRLVKLRLTRTWEWERGTGASWLGAFPNVPLHSVSFDRQRFPALDTLGIEGVRLILKEPQTFISQLRVLDVQRCVLLCDPPILSLSTFLGTLTSCPSLEEVRLTRMLSQFHHDLESQDGPGRATHPFRIGIVSIPKLRKLTLRDEAGVVSSFMSRLHVPSSVKVHLVSELGSLTQDTPTLFLPLLPHNWRQTFPFVDNVRHLCVLFDAFHQMFDVHVSGPEGADLTHSIRVTDDSARDRQYYTCLPLYAHVPLTDVTVDLSMDKLLLEEADWARLFAAFPAVENFSTSGTCIDVHKLLAALAQSQPATGEDGPRGSCVRVVCPKLQTVFVHGPFWSDDATLDCIVGCLAARTRGGATALEKLELDLSYDSWRHFERAKGAFLGKIGAVFAGETVFGYDWIEELDTGVSPSDDDNSDEDDNDYDSDDNDDDDNDNLNDNDNDDNNDNDDDNNNGGGNGN